MGPNAARNRFTLNLVIVVLIALSLVFPSPARNALAGVGETVQSAFVVAQAPSAPLASNGSDNASNAAYSPTWDTSDNGGSGFGAWTLTGSASSGFFVGSSTGNNSGPDYGSDGDINSSGGKSWGLYANTGQSANAVRTLNAPLYPGSVFTIFMDKGERRHE